MKLSKTTTTFSTKRGFNVDVMEIEEGLNILTISEEEADNNKYLEYIANEDGSFSYKYNEDLVSKGTKEELPATIKDEKHLREVIEFISNEI